MRCAQVLTGFARRTPSVEHGRDSRSARLRVIAEYQLSVVDRDALARIMVHAHLALLVAQPVAHLVALLLDGALIDRGALALARRVGVAALHPILYAVAGVAARCGAHSGSDVTARAAADIMPEQSTHHGARDGAHDLVLVPRGTLVHHGLLVAVLPGRADGPRERSDLHHFRILRTPVHDFETGHRSRAYGYRRAGRQTNHQRPVHCRRCLLRANGGNCSQALLNGN